MSHAAFKSHEDAMKWARVYARENVRPSDKWEIVRIEEAHEYRVAIKFKSDGKLIGYAE
jgi:hypothetical protein